MLSISYKGGAVFGAQNEKSIQDRSLKIQGVFGCKLHGRN